MAHPRRPTGAASGNVTGRASITVTDRPTAAFAAVLALVAPEPGISGIRVLPGTILLSAIGDSAKLTAEARDSAGAAVTGSTVAWSSPDLAIVTVSGRGFVRSRLQGSARMVASERHGVRDRNGNMISGITLQ